MADLSKLRFNGTDYNVKDASAPLRKFTNYSKTGNLPITSDDTTQTAIGKLEKALDDKINTSAKGTASGVAELDANGKVPSSQLPSYVDDVLEYSAKSSFPTTGETGKIYVDTTTNKTYRWSGSAYVEISESLALGETSSTAYRGDRGKSAYDHSQITNGNPHGTTGANTNLTGYSKGSSKDAVAATDTVNVAIAKHENRINANQTNILYAIRNGAKNLCNPILDPAYYNKNGANITRTYSNGAITIKGTTAAAEAYLSVCEEFTPITTGDYVFSSASGLIQGKLEMYVAAGSSFVGERVTSNNPARTYSLTAGTTYTLGMVVLGNYTIDTTIYPMLCEKTVWDNLNHDFQPPSLPNYDLTRLEAEDRAELMELVDSGAKQLVQIHSATNGYSSATPKSDGYSVTLSGAARANTSLDFGTLKPNKTGTHVFKVTLSGTVDNVLLWDQTANKQVYSANTSDVVEVALDATHNYTVGHYTNSAKTLNGEVSVLICTKAAFGVSNKFVPYRPNWDLVCSNVETVIKGLKTVTADYALIPGLTVDIPPYAYVEYKCGMLWDGTGPRGVIVSLLNTDPYYAQAGSVVGKAECTESQLVLTVSGEYINNSNTTKTFYVWAKGAGSASNYMWLAYKFVK